MSVKGQGWKNESASSSIIGPPPNAAALAKYADIPVGLYTGKPDVKLDIVNLTEGSISLPVDLRYDAAGIKIADVASRVGLGWTLNAGGVITRSVVGLPDETGGIGYNYTYNKLPSSNGGPVTNFTDSLRFVYIGTLDAEPDIYYFNIGKLSGKFVNTGNGFVCQPLSNVKIYRQYENGASVFRLIDGDGFTYIFNDIEYVDDESSQKTTYASTAWYLTKIINPNGTDIVSFEYDDQSYARNADYAEIFYELNSVIGDCRGAYPDSRNYIKNDQVISGKLLKRITGSNWQLNFSYSSREDNNDLKLDAIALYDLFNQRQLKEFRFTYDYFTYGGVSAHTKLKLTKMTEQAGADKGRVYNFEYYNDNDVPPITSRSQDHWGYYNGKPNTTLIPSYVDVRGNYVQGADREPAVQYISNGMLKRIVYPTGGNTLFEYEPHEFSSIMSGTMPNPSYEQVPASASITVQNSGTQYLEKTFTVSFTQVVQLSYLLCNCRNGCSVTPCQSPSALPPSTHVYLKNSAGIKLFDMTATEANKVKQGTTSLNLTQGTYTLVGEAYESFDNGTLTASYQDYNTSKPIKKWAGGGIRIKRITHQDGTSNNVKTYNYNKAGDETTSNGILLTAPAYISNMSRYTIKTSTDGLNTPYCYDACPIVVHSSYAQNVLGVSSGSHVVYTLAVEKIGENGINGEVDYEFTGPDFYTYRVPPFTSISKFWKEGLLLRKTVLNAGLQKTREEQYSYQYEPIPERPAVMGLKLSAYVLCDADKQLSTGYFTTSRAYIDNYQYTFEKLRKKQDVITTYSSTGAESLVTTSTTNFENNIHFNPTSSEFTDSKNLIIRNDYKYADNFSSDNVYASMVTKNMLNQVIEKNESRQGQQRVYEKNGYAIFNNSMVLPGSSIKSVLSSPAEPEITYNKYNAAGRPIEVIRRNGDPTAYVWNYHSNYAVAKADGAAYNDIAYTSFEADEKGNWNYPNAPVQGSGITGKQCYNLAGDVSASNLNTGKTYIVSYWSKNGAYQVQGTGPSRQGQTINGWIYYEHTVSGTSTVAIAGAGYIDELRLYPLGAQMSTYTYDPLMGLTAEITPASQITFYEYDGLGRLKIIRDQNNNVIKKFDYQYSTQ